MDLAHDNRSSHHTGSGQIRITRVTSIGQRARSRAAAAWLLAILAAGTAGAGMLERQLGRSEVRVRSAPFPLVAGSTVVRSRLPERLERLGYERVGGRPERAGQYFWGHEIFWIYRRAHRVAGVDHAPSLIGLELRRSDGLILGATSANGKRYRLDTPGTLWLEPELLSESLTADRARRTPVAFDDLPDRVWRTVLAAEDARFFRHAGVDARALARAALANLRAGQVAQGGSTITQQLIKNRDLTPKRTIGRKLSEAARALLLEAEYDKKEILETYLNHVYLGHVEGLAIHGIGAASRAYFSKPAEELTLGEAALLAGMIRGPNSLSPLRHPDRATERRNRVLARMEELGWAEARDVRAAQRDEVDLDPESPRRPVAAELVRWAGGTVTERFSRRTERGRGVVLDTTLDPVLQEIAERAVRERLAALRADHRSLRGAPLAAALVALDATSGEVLAYVAGDPSRREPGFDRARNARRQPGSTVKPLALLEAFESCGPLEPLHPATRVLDAPVRIDLPSGVWEPENYDRRYRGVVDVRQALTESINVPFVRIVRACGVEGTAARMRRAGLELPDDPPPSFVLGALETSPLELAGAFTVFATTPGRAYRPFAVRRVERPGGRVLMRGRSKARRVVRPSTAFLVRDLMRDAVERGTARVARIEGLDVAAKTGTTRDSWFAGHAGSIVAVAWVGLDDGTSLELTGARAAGPIWHRFMRDAVPARPARILRRPADLVVRQVDPETGLLVGERNRRAREELFRRGAMPPRDRFWRLDRPVPVLR